MCQETAAFATEPPANDRCTIVCDDLLKLTEAPLLILTTLLVLPGMEQASAPASASAPAAGGREPLLATRDSGSSSRLFYVDPVSLRPLGTRSLRLDFHWGDFARSPDGSLLALSRNDAPELRFVRLGELRLAGAMRFPNGTFVRLLA